MVTDRRYPEKDVTNIRIALETKARLERFPISFKCISNVVGALLDLWDATVANGKDPLKVIEDAEIKKKAMDNARGKKVEE